MNYHNLRNWKWWVACLLWLPLIVPLGILQLLIFNFGLFLECIGLRVKLFAKNELYDFFTWASGVDKVENWWKNE